MLACSVLWIYLVAGRSLVKVGEVQQWSPPLHLPHCDPKWLSEETSSGWGTETSLPFLDLTNCVHDAPGIRASLLWGGGPGMWVGASVQRADRDWNELFPLGIHKPLLEYKSKIVLPDRPCLLLSFSSSSATFPESSMAIMCSFPFPWCLGLALRPYDDFLSDKLFQSGLGLFSFSPATNACYIHTCIVLVFDDSHSGEEVVAHYGPALSCDQWVLSLRILSCASSTSFHSNP